MDKNAAAAAFTPRETVSELDRYIIGQRAAKRAVAVALRNRWRRRRLAPDLRDEVSPKNIILIGPTGVGKTEIARRLAKLAQAPFIKVEASKFTEVGYVGRDVESMVRDLTDLAVQMVSEEDKRTVAAAAQARAEERVLDSLLPESAAQPEAPGPQMPPGFPFAALAKLPGMPSIPGMPAAPEPEPPGPSARKEEARRRGEAREQLRRQLREGELDARELEIELEAAPPQLSFFSPHGMEDLGAQVRDLMGSMFGGKSKKRRMKVPAALAAFQQEEAGKLIDQDSVRERATERVEQDGIVFLDELDKVAAPGGAARYHGGGGGGGGGAPDISREGVQRDLLPIVEGSTVQTKHGPVNTDHILFIAAGAFHAAKPSDLIPELQGRFPIRVELESLGEAEFLRILKEPQNSLVRQYGALLATENVRLDFTPEGLREIARIAADVNARTDNIGARRLQTVMEKLLDEISFDAPDRGGITLTIDETFVRQRLEALVQDEDLSRYIL